MPLAASQISQSTQIPFSGNAAVDIFSPGPAMLLEKNDQVWGVLQSVRAVGGGLIEAVIGSSGMGCLLPEDLMTKVQGLVGKRVIALRVDNHFTCEGLE